MTDLQLDSDAVSATGSALNSAGWALSTDVDLALAACGSSSVSAAADNWALWAKATLLLTQGKTTGSGRAASDAASEFSAQEQALATSAAKG